MKSAQRIIVAVSHWAGTIPLAYHFAHTNG